MPCTLCQCYLIFPTTRLSRWEPPSVLPPSSRSRARPWGIQNLQWISDTPVATFHDHEAYKGRTYRYFCSLDFPISFGLLSLAFSSCLFLYLTYRLLSWRWKAGFSQPTNQFLLLIYNLLLADIQQAMAFMLNIDALRHNSIRVGTTTCWAQGWFVSVGDLASSVFIFAIAMHTFLGVVKGYRPPTWLFWCGVMLCWAFVYGLGAAGPLVRGEDFYVRASAWCWINHKYSSDRLWLHYFWIFLAMFSTALIYVFIIIYLRTRASSQSIPQRTIHGATPLMIIYPLIYTVCTAPLALGRIAALAGHHVSLGYFCFAGSMIASNGWLDVLLYASTRRDIVFSEYPPGEDTGIETFAFMGKGHHFGTVTTIQGGGGMPDRNSSRADGYRRGHRPSESVENLYGLGDIAVKGTVSVKIEEAPRGALERNESGHGSREASQSWDERSGKSIRI